VTSASGGIPRPRRPVLGRRRARRAVSLALAAALVSLAPVGAMADPSPSRLRRAIDPVVSRPEFASAFWGIEVRSLATGRTLYARNAEKAFRPASSMKLVTTAAALDAYGPDARLLTTVESEGRLDGLGRVLGDVFLVGHGDPNLSARFTPGRPTAAFEAMADTLVAAGVRRIEGRLIGHEGAFVGERRGSDWTWEDLAWGYGAEVSALSWNDNLAQVSLHPGERVGDPAVLDVVPDAGCLAVVSSVTTAEAAPKTTTPASVAGADDEVALARAPGSDEVRLSGRVRLGGSWDGELAVGDPARCAARAFQRVLESKGIRVMGGVATSSLPLPQGARVLAAHSSAPMAELIRVVNKESQNLHAEMLLRLVGLKVEGEGSASKGHQAVAEFLERLGVPAEGWGLVDGSGLARTDLVTPRGLVALLVAMDRHPHAAAFRDSLPVAGVDGTLEKRMRGTAAERRVAAKTGTLRLANALAGYVTTERGERLAFAVMVNDHAGRGREAVAAIDAIAAALALR
jgi:serine-type D-Ala-D-Ala carboxypeptidase/endopeptidase (penicillin-binding protein 4)